MSRRKPSAVLFAHGFVITDLIDHTVSELRITAIEDAL